MPPLGAINPRKDGGERPMCKTRLVAGLLTLVLVMAPWLSASSALAASAAEINKDASAALARLYEKVPEARTLASWSSTRARPRPSPPRPGGATSTPSSSPRKGSWLASGCRARRSAESKSSRRVPMTRVVDGRVTEVACVSKRHPNSAEDAAIHRATLSLLRFPKGGRYDEPRDTCSERHALPDHRGHRWSGDRAGAGDEAEHRHHLGR